MSTISLNNIFTNVLISTVTSESVIFMHVRPHLSDVLPKPSVV